MNEVEDDVFSVLLIPHSLARDHLGRAPGGRPPQPRGRPHGPLRRAPCGGGERPIESAARPPPLRGGLGDRLAARVDGFGRAWLGSPLATTPIPDRSTKRRARHPSPAGRGERALSDSNRCSRKPPLPPTAPRFPEPASSIVEARFYDGIADELLAGAQGRGRGSRSRSASSSPSPAPSRSRPPSPSPSTRRRRSAAPTTRRWRSAASSGARRAITTSSPARARGR